MVHPPEKAIAIWAGTLASIPSGWNLCDGTNSTPDLASKFVRGAPASTEAGSTGGALTHSHTEQSTGAHTHPTDSVGAHGHTTGTAGNHTHGINHNVIQNSGSGGYFSEATNQGGHTHTVVNSSTHSHTLDSQGAHVHVVAAPADTLPPFYDILFIQATVTAEVVTGINIVWTGLRAAIPDGWLENTDLRSQYVRGAPDGLNAGGTGGAPTHTHETQNDAGHTHGSDSQGNHTHTFNAYVVAHNHTTNAPRTTASSGSCGKNNSVAFTHTHATSDSIGAHTHTFQTGGIHNHGYVQEYASDPAYCKVIFIKCDDGIDIPEKGILLWAGLLEDIPDQYDLCDGADNRTDLRGKFLLGAAAGVEAGGTGGSDTHTHTDNAAGIHLNHTQDAFSTAHQHANTDNIGAHHHTTITSTSGAYTYSSNDVSAGAHNHAYGNDAWSHSHTPTNNASTHTHTIDNADTRPPYYEVQFIWRTAVTNAIQKIVTDTVGALDNLAGIVEAFKLTLSDSIGALDTLATSTVARLKGVVDMIGAVDSKLRVLSLRRSFSDLIGALDSLSPRIIARFKALTDNIGALDSYISIKTLIRTFTDMLGTLDTKLRILSLIRTFTDKIGLTDSRTSNVANTGFRWTWKEHPRIKLEEEEV